MTTISLDALMYEHGYDAASASCLKSSDVAGLKMRFFAGACATSLVNVLHYQPNRLQVALDATVDLPPALRSHTRQVLRAICNKRRETLLPLLEGWMNEFESDTVSQAS